MNLFRSLVFVLSAQFCMFTACQKNPGNDVKNPVDIAVDSVAADSDALVLALTPTVECLPIYYAHHKGIFKTLGLKVGVKTYASQFDCDTAILGKTAVGGTSDLVRLHYYANAGKYLSAVSALDGIRKLVVSGDLRIKKMSLLNDRTIAVARFSASDYFSEVAARSAGMEIDGAMRPQVNNYGLLTAMLKNHQVDAAILPEPYATKAVLSGHNVLFVPKKNSERLGCLLFKPSSLASKDSSMMIRQILKGYNMAVDDLNGKGLSVCRDILLKDYQMPKAVIDSLKLSKYSHASVPSKEDVQKVQAFMKERSRWTEGSNSNLLFNGNLIP